MAQIKLTKNELRTQQIKLGQLTKYLPTLQLKKALLQVEVNAAEVKIAELMSARDKEKAELLKSSKLMCDKDVDDLYNSIEIVEVKKSYENIAGIDCPVFESVEFVQRPYGFFDSPLWMDALVDQTKSMLSAREAVHVMEEKKAALEQELREVSIRVNLFEKIMIPRTQENIKKIKVFLGDQQLAAVAQAKVAKQKIEERKRHDN